MRLSLNILIKKFLIFITNILSILIFKLLLVRNSNIHMRKTLHIFIIIWGVLITIRTITICKISLRKYLLILIIINDINLIPYNKCSMLFPSTTSWNFRLIHNILLLLNLNLLTLNSFILISCFTLYNYVIIITNILNTWRQPHISNYLSSIMIYSQST